MTLEDIAALRVVDVSITFKPDAHISWATVEQDFVDQAKAERARDPKTRHKQTVHEENAYGVVDPVAAEHQRLVASPEGKAFVQKKIAALINARLKRDIVPQLNGSREARLEIVVVGFVIPHTVQRVVLGGVPVLGAITHLKDARTGAELAKLDQGASAYGGGGISTLVVEALAAPLEDRLVDAYVANVRRWLLKN